MAPAGIRRPRMWSGIAEGLVLILLVATVIWRIAADRGGDVAGLSPVHVASESVPSLLARANQAYESSNLAAAGAWYADVLKSDADNVVARVRMANIFHQNAWNDNAKRLLDEALVLEPGDREARLLMAKIFRDEGQPEEATQEYEALLMQEPNNSEAHYYLGTAYQSERRFEEAILEYQEAIRSDADLETPPFDVVPFGLKAGLQLGRAYRQLSRFAMQNGEIDDARALLDLASDVLRDTVARVQDTALAGYTEPTSELVGVLDATARLVRRTRGDESEVLALFMEMTRVDPEDPVAWLEAGQVTRTLAKIRRDVEVALTYFQKAFELDPRYSDAHTNLVAATQLLEYSDDDLREALKGMREE